MADVRAIDSSELESGGKKRGKEKKTMTNERRWVVEKKGHGGKNQPRRFNNAGASIPERRFDQRRSSSSLGKKRRGGRGLIQ